MRELAEHLSLPVAHTLMGKGALPDDHPLILGMTGFWGTKFINDKCKGADWILGLGTRFSEADCSSWEREYTFNFPPTKLIHIDIDPAEIGRNYPVAIGAVADLEGGAEGAEPRRAEARAARRQAARARGRDRGQPHELRRRQPAGDGEQRVADAARAHPRRRARRRCRAMRSSAPTWAGTRTASASSSRSTTPGTIFTPGGYATMGFGSPAALGAKVACPDRVVVALIGDGGFGQNPAMLATAFEEDIAVVWVIMNNHAFGTIAGLETAHYGTTFGTVFEKDGKTWSPDYAAIARAYGVDGVKVALGRRVQAGAGEGDQVEAARRHRRVHEERAGADGGPLEHHGHLLARQEGPPRQHRRLTPANEGPVAAAGRGRGRGLDRRLRGDAAQSTRRGARTA